MTMSFLEWWVGSLALEPTKKLKSLFLNAISKLEVTTTLFNKGNAQSMSSALSPMSASSLSKVSCRYISRGCEVPSKLPLQVHEPLEILPSYSESYEICYLPRGSSNCNFLGSCLEIGTQGLPRSVRQTCIGCFDRTCRFCEFLANTKIH